MKQNARFCARKFLIGAVAVFGILTFSIRSGFAKYISEPELIETSPKTITVTVNLTASPTEGLAPLPVTFTCTATAEVYYIEVWAQPPQGSVNKEKEITEMYTAKITEQPKPATQVLMKPNHTYTFTAKAKYKSATGQDSVTVKTGDAKCMDLFLAKEAAKAELEKAEKEAEKLNKIQEKLKKETKILKDKWDDLNEVLRGVEEAGAILRYQLWKKHFEKTEKAKNRYLLKQAELMEVIRIYNEAKKDILQKKKELKAAQKAYDECLLGK